MAFFVMEKKERPILPKEEPCGGRVVEIDAAKIRKNPAQPRREFDADALLALSESIRQHGILQPPVVRQVGDDRYELIAGERRLRAALLSGMQKIPCLLREGDDSESAELAMIENLQREDLNMFEEAIAIASLCEKYGMTQEQIGRRLSVSQSYIANKLRLLRLSEEARMILLGSNLTERHARAVLRLPEEKRLPALRHIAAEGLNVAASERYVERLLTEKKCRPRMGVIKDIRLFYNSVDRAVQLVKESGIGIVSERHESEDTIEMVIRIDKTRRRA